MVNFFPVVILLKLIILITAFFIYYSFYVYMVVLPACMSVYHLSAWSVRGQKRASNT